MAMVVYIYYALLDSERQQSASENKQATVWHKPTLSSSNYLHVLIISLGDIHFNFTTSTPKINKYLDIPNVVPLYSSPLLNCFVFFLNANYK